MKNREAKLIPKYISIRVEENRLSIQYNVNDSLSGVNLHDGYINFTPTKELMEALESEIELAINNQKP